MQSHQGGKRVFDGTSGSMQRVTINHVAARAGVSKKTVSHVVNGLGSVSAATRRRVEAAVAELGYSANPQARAFASGRTSLAILVHDGSDEGAMAQLLEGLQDGLEPQGLAVAVHRSADATTLAAYLAAHRPLGVILPPSLSEKTDLAEVCKAAGCRTAPILSEPGHETALCVDERQAAADATGWLLALGHRRIAFIAGPDTDPRARACELGFISAMAGPGREQGVEIIAQGDFSAASGERAAQLLLEISPRPTAILAANDLMAAGAMRALLAAGLQLPQDISVMGLGNAPIAELLMPPLASVALPWRAIGLLAAKRLSGGTELTAPGALGTLAGTLISRGSVGPAVD